MFQNVRGDVRQCVAIFANVWQKQGTLKAYKCSRMLANLWRCPPMCGMFQNKYQHKNYNALRTKIMAFGCFESFEIIFRNLRINFYALGALFTRSQKAAFRVLQMFTNAWRCSANVWQCSRTIFPHKQGYIEGDFRKISYLLKSEIASEQTNEKKIE